MKQTRLNSLEELKTRKAGLKADQQFLGNEIFNEAKLAVINLPIARLVKPADPLKILKVDGKINPSAKLFSYLLSLVTNRILFRRSGFITRMITALIARKIGKRIGPKIAAWLINIILKYTRNLTAKPGLSTYRIQPNNQKRKLLK